MNILSFQKRIIIALAALVLSGCMTVGPDYSPPEMQTPATWQREFEATSEAQTADDALLKRGTTLKIKVS